MLFTSYRFLGFIFALFILYYLVPKRCQWMLLLAASYIFYAHAGWECLIFIGVTTLTTYAVGCIIDGNHKRQKQYLAQHKAELSKEEKKAYKEKQKNIRFVWMTVCLVLNFGILAVLKYTNFAIANVNGILQAAGSDKVLAFRDLILPLGISFYTFQSMGYLIDIHRGKYSAQKNIFKFALFVSFFPQLIQGPISRYDDLEKGLFSSHCFDWHTISLGLQRILWGYFKKLVIADRMLIGVKTLISDTDTYTGFYVFLGMIFYALQLYADFTGGIDITIGIGQVLGVPMRENFIRPYFSKGIKEYWRRWHISLGDWFTDYLFYPISVCKPMLKVSKLSRKLLGEQIGKRVPVYASSIAVWFVTGIWHGAAWNFVVWGLGNCFFIMLSQECEPLYEKFHARFRVKETTWFKAFRIIRTFLLMSSLRMLDCYRDVPMTFRMFGSMFTDWNIGEVLTTGMWNLGLGKHDYIVLVIGTATLIVVSLIGRRGSVREMIAKKPIGVSMAVFGALFVATVLFGAYGMGYDASQFIYNQF